MWIAGWFDEMMGAAGRTARDLFRGQGQGAFVYGVDAMTDCYSLYSPLRNSDPVRPADGSLTVYVAALRQDVGIGRIRRLYWVNTLAMAADALAKGSVPRDSLQ